MSFAKPDYDVLLRPHTEIHAHMSAGEKHMNECVAQFSRILTSFSLLCWRVAAGYGPAAASRVPARFTDLMCR